MTARKTFHGCIWVICMILLGACQKGAVVGEDKEIISAKSRSVAANKLPAPQVEVGLFELSGAASVQDGVLLADDELIGSVYFAPHDASGDLIFKLIKIERKRKKSAPFTSDTKLFPVQDFEGLAADGDKVYLLGSHQAHRSQSRRSDREFLIKAQWDEGELKFKAQYNDLLSDIVNVLSDQGVAVSITNTQVTPIINIEGMAVSNGNLFLGIREPLLNGNAIVLKADEADLFSGNPQFKVSSLPLGGAGIRGLHWDEVNDRLLVLSGGKDDVGDIDPDIVAGIWTLSAGADSELVYTFTAVELGGPAGEKRAKPEAISALPDGRIAVYMDGEGAAGNRVLYLDSIPGLQSNE